MLTEQACQQHRLVVMDPNNAKSLPAATVSWDTTAESVGPTARRVETLVGCMRVSKKIGYGGVEAW